MNFKDITARFSLFTLAIVLLYSCNKQAEHNPAPVTTNPEASTIAGSLYLIVDDSVKMFNAKTGVKAWAATDDVYFEDAMSPLVYDASGVYHGGAYGLKCYQASSGGGVWELGFNDPTLGPFADFAIPAFVDDSLALATSATGVYIGGCELYCYNKFTGKRLWYVPVDYNINGLDPFKTIPVTVGNTVVLITKEWSSNFKVTGFNPQTGKQVWQSDYNPYLTPYIKSNGGNIYVPAAQTVWCYSGTNGAMLWQTTLDSPTGSQYAASSFDDQYQYITRANADGTYTIFKLDKTSGSVIGTTPVPLNTGATHIACKYQSGMLYITDLTGQPGYNEVLYAYSFPSMQVKWSYKFTSKSAPYLPPLVTDKYVVFPAAAGETVSTTNPTDRIVFLDLNGKLVKEVKYPGYKTSKYVYVDDNGTPWTNDEY